MRICDQFLGHIRWMADMGVSNQEIGEVFGYTPEQVRKMVCGKERKYVKAKPLWTLEALVRLPA